MHASRRPRAVAMENYARRLRDFKRYVQDRRMKYRVGVLLMIIAVVSHACVKQSWSYNLCADGSTLVTNLIPFTIQTEYDDGESAHRRTYVGVCGFYKLASSTSLPVHYSGTRYCYVPKFYDIDGSKLAVMIRGNGSGFVHLSGFVPSSSDLESAILVLDEHNWAGSSRAYVDIQIGDTSSRKRFWHELRGSTKST